MFRLVEGGFMRNLGRIAIVFALAVGCARLWAGSATEDLRKEIDDLRRQLNSDGSAESTIQSVDVMSNAHANYDSHDNKVTSHSGNLQIGGLLQIWDTTIFKDNRDVYGSRGGGVLDNSGNRIRRAELKFSMDIHENITAVVMFDAAREATSYPNVPNQGLFKSSPTINSDRNGAFTTDPTKSIVAQVQNGAGEGNRILQDAYINVHDLIPHHDVTIGQFKPPAGEEGVRSSANLDFVERAMVNQLNDLRDLGAQIHGTWWEDCETKIGRIQYWAGVFDGAGNYFDTAGDFQNRSDDNDAKDVAGKLMVRPIWSDCWGRLEVGAWGQYGHHGESGDNSVDGSAPVNGLNRLKTNAYRMGAWVMYKPVWFLKGAWVRGEYGNQRDRTAPFTVDAFGLGSGPNGEQASPNPFKREGWYMAAGYKLTDSIFANRLSKGGFFNRLLQPVEFVGRYESFENIVVENSFNPDQLTDLYRTHVFTAGVNYYVNAYKHRIQVNYMNVEECVNPNQHPGIRGANDNMLVMSYQIQF